MPISFRLGNRGRTLLAYDVNFEVAEVMIGGAVKRDTLVRVNQITKPWQEGCLPDAIKWQFIDKYVSYRFYAIIVIL